MKYYVCASTTFIHSLSPKHEFSANDDMKSLVIKTGGAKYLGYTQKIHKKEVVDNINDIG